MKTFYEAGHDKPKQNRVNFYYLVEFFAIVLVLIIVLGLKTEINKKVLSSWASIIIAAEAILIGVQLKFSSTRITNNSNKDVICKPEAGSELFLLPAGQVTYDVDGYAIDGKIYKTPDGLHITINEKGKMKIASFIGKMFGIIGFARVLLKAPDKSWQPLFEETKEKNNVE